MLKGIEVLVLTRKLGESIAIGDRIKVQVVQIKGRQVRLGIDAPTDTKIHREEVYTSIQEENRASHKTSSQVVQKLSHLLKVDEKNNHKDQNDS